VQSVDGTTTLDVICIRYDVLSVLSAVDSKAIYATRRRHSHMKVPRGYPKLSTLKSGTPKCYAVVDNAKTPQRIPSSLYADRNTVYVR
jgi:hypothetical protein